MKKTIKQVKKELMYGFLFAVSYGLYMLLGGVIALERGSQFLVLSSWIVICFFLTLILIRGYSEIKEVKQNVY